MRILAAVFTDVVFRLAESGTRDYADCFAGLTGDFDHSCCNRRS
jgi:hypothetical protein